MTGLRAAVAGVVGLAMCTGGDGSRGQDRAALVSQDTAAFAGSTEPVQRLSRVAPTHPALLSAVRAVRAAGFDRLMFEFSGDSLPGYQIEYATEPIRSCGSGDVVWPAGEGQLVVRFQPAQAHDSLGRVTVAERSLAPDLPMVKEMKLVCDFEGQIEWAFRLDASSPYRVIEAAAPARLTLDVRHRD